MAHINIGFVVVMGMGTVFFGLICIVFLISVMGKLFGKDQAESGQPAAKSPRPVGKAKKKDEMDPRVLAAILAVLSQEPQFADSKLRVLSIRKVKG